MNRRSRRGSHERLGERHMRCRRSEVRRQLVSKRDRGFLRREGNHSLHLIARLVFNLGALAILLVLRWMDPVVAGIWLPFHTSCGATTGLPCIFCGMTRALHLLLNGDFTRAIYFNWLAIPFLAVIVFLIGLFAIELARRRVIVNLGIVFPMTSRRLTIIGLCLFVLWTSQAYLAVSHHKRELLNPRGPLYGLFVRGKD